MSDNPPLHYEFCKQIDELVGIEHFEQIARVIENSPAGGERLSKNGDYLIRCQEIGLSADEIIYVAYGTSRRHNKVFYLFATRDKGELDALFGSEGKTAKRFIANIFKRIAIVLTVGVGEKLFDDGFG